VRDLLWDRPVRERSAGPVGCRHPAQGGLQDRKWVKRSPCGFTVLRLAVCRCARSLSGSKAWRWIVCQPRTLTVLVPGNPLLGPPGFRGGPAAQDLVLAQALGPGERADNKTWA
jgi:hypothetical protein